MMAIILQSRLPKFLISATLVLGALMISALAESNPYTAKPAQTELTESRKVNYRRTLRFERVSVAPAKPWLLSLVSNKYHALRQAQLERNLNSRWADIRKTRRITSIRERIILIHHAIRYAEDSDSNLLWG